ncbi:MAG: tRNA (N(6)-L-threonylcarbamoyladenosine(37)-C(2))-methylthiotransferase MtaB [Desulfotalea sp.]
MKIHITTLGCKVNQFESASFADNLKKAGHKIINKDKADWIIVNTCAVTAAGGAQSRQNIRQALKNSPKASIIITGCYVEIAAAEIIDMEVLQGRTYYIIGNSCKDQVVDVIAGKKTDNLILGEIKSATEICRLPVENFGDRTRTYLRIQDGCESFCTYCIVPFTRGPSRSLPVDEVLAQAHIFAQAGYKETVLTGIHIGAWGKDFSSPNNFTALMDKLSNELPEMHFRISSLEPIEITKELLSLMTTRKNIFPHLHIPLQSGDDEILTAMHRRYDTTEYTKVINNCHKAVPEICIGIDILAGFPGETEEHFNRAYSYLENLDFCYLHVFPYSIRPGTEASTFTDQVSGDIKNIRVKKLRNLSNAKKSKFYQKQIGKTLPVLVEGKRTDDGLLKGYTDNYVSVHFHGSDDLMRTSVQVTLKENLSNHVTGILAS